MINGNYLQMDTHPLKNISQNVIYNQLIGHMPSPLGHISSAETVEIKPYLGDIYQRTYYSLPTFPPSLKKETAC